MVAERFDVAVVGSGPAGSVAALILARAGAKVALVDKAGFPRDKACGDVVGPRGIALLRDLDLAPATAGGVDVGEMVVVGPSGGRVRLPCFAGVGYPGYGVAVPRQSFDAWLAHGAAEAGARPVRGRVEGLAARRERIDGVDGVELAGGRRLRADVVIGADGATSRVAEAAGLVDTRRVLWGFAVRVYLDQPVALPHILLWEEERGRAFPGYGWLFPGPDGRANAGLGIGVLSASLCLFRRGPNRIQPPQAIAGTLRFIGRYTLEIYAIELGGFELIVKLLPDLAAG